MALIKMCDRDRHLSKLFMLKWLCFIFIWSFGISLVECCCRERLYTHVKGCCNSTGVLSTHRVGSLGHCGLLSLKFQTCAGFKYRPTNDNLPNCESFKRMENCSTCVTTNSQNAGWKFYKAVFKKSTSVCLNNQSCKNGGTCVENPSNKENGFDCICKGNFSGKYCETVTGIFSSCKSLLEVGRDVPNGDYVLSQTRGTKVARTYCQMTSLEGCAGGGWTMVMKIDGSKTTFNYSSEHWSSEYGYQKYRGSRFGFDDIETKMPSYWSTSFSEICIGMKVDNDLRFLTIPYAGETLLSLIADGQFRATNISSEKWKSLIANSSLQAKCHKEGFNIYYSNTDHTAARIGIVGDEEENCNNPDSFLGLGGKYNIVSPNCYANVTSFPVSGNLASCTADNGKVNIKSMGYILIR